MLRASLLARLYLARNSGAGYTREFHSGTYEAPFSTRSELWWSIFRLPFPPVPSTLQRLYVPTLSSASRGKARRKWLFHQSYTDLSMEVRPVGALRQKFKTRYMRRDGGENRIRVAVPRGYISSRGYPIRSPRHGTIE